MAISELGLRLIEKHRDTIVGAAIWRNKSMLPHVPREILESEAHLGMCLVAASWENYCEKHNQDINNEKLFINLARRRASGQILDYGRSRDAVARSTRRQLRDEDGDLSDVHPAKRTDALFLEADHWKAIPDQHRSVESQIETSEMIEFLVSQIKLLDKESQFIITSRYFADQQLIDIARQLGRTEAWVGKANKLALTKLKTVMVEKYGDLTVPVVEKETRIYSSKGKSKYKGITWDRHNNRWRAQILIDGKQVYIGQFLTEEKAAEAYAAAYAREHEDTLDT